MCLYESAISTSGITTHLQRDDQQNAADLGTGKAAYTPFMNCGRRGHSATTPQD
jgi:hypothetical protein